MKKLRFGIMGTAAIARDSLIPAMQKSGLCEVAAIASRNASVAGDVARRMGVEKHYGSYESLLQDPGIDVVYIPLPNHLHVSWTLKSLAAGKHVLCEKPLAVSLEESLHFLEELRHYPRLKVMEAFMYRFHPQWQRARAMIRRGEIGRLQSILSVFTFFDDDPATIVNRREYGGGALRDIGCYNISLSRYLFEDEPARVSGSVEYDKTLGVDTLASAVLTFGQGTSAFTCGIRQEEYQRVQIFGTEGRIEIEWPFNPPPDQETVLLLTQGGDTRRIVLPPADQYTLMVDAFARAVMEDTPVPLPPEDAVDNMRVLEAVIDSDASGRTIRTK